MESEIKNNSTEVSNDDRLLGMLCHLSFFLGGIILPIIIWAVQKDKSKFVRFHSLQAIFFHICIGVIIFLFVMILLFVFLITGLSMDTFSKPGYNGGENLPAFVIVMMVLLYGGIFLLVIGVVVYTIFLAVKTYQGKLIKIPVIGNIIYNRVFGTTKSTPNKAVQDNTGVQ